MIDVLLEFDQEWAIMLYNPIGEYTIDCLDLDDAKEFVRNLQIAIEALEKING